MIKLSPEAIYADPFLASFPQVVWPTHAEEHGISVHTDPGSYSIKVTYWFGNLNANGKFVQSTICSIVNVQIPNMQAMLANMEVLNLSAADFDRMLSNLFDADVAPNPRDPRETISIPGKKQGDWKKADLDAVCAWAHPKLKGEVI